MHEPDQHVSPIKNWKQLVVVVVLAFVVPIVVIVLLSQYVTGGPKGASHDDNAVLARIKPIGDVQLAVASGPKGQATGEQVYGQICKTCHEGGLAGAPKVGDKAAWGKIVAQGLTPTLDHAVKGIRAMPPKGGNPDLETIEVERAVIFMANKAGANWKEPPAPATAKGAERTGEEVVKAACGRCHETGQGGAPKVGDRAAWTPRVAKGLATVTQAALKGHGGMPARGGMADLSDAEVKARDRVHVQFGCRQGARGNGACRGSGRTGGGRRGAGERQAGRQEDLRHHLHGLPRHRRSRRAEAGRQGGLGAAPEDRPGRAVCVVAQGQGRDARQGRLVAARCRRQGSGRLHGRRGEVIRAAGGNENAARGPRFFVPAEPRHPPAATVSRGSASPSISPRAASRSSARCDR